MQSKAFVKLGDCRDLISSLDDNSIDSCITDPPYELTKGNGKTGFMGKIWDGTGIAFDVDMWKDVLRVLKPGGYIMVFGATRTFYKVAQALDDAGFEIIDVIPWIRSDAMPKGQDISLAIDKLRGEERDDRVIQDWKRNTVLSPTQKVIERGEPVSEDAKKWHGWYTQLKPANEPIILARKPLSEKTFIANVLKYDTGAMNIDACRLEPYKEGVPGRVPTNLVFSHSAVCNDDKCDDDCAVLELRNQSEQALQFFPIFKYNAKASTKERPIIFEQVCECVDSIEESGKCTLCGVKYNKIAHMTIKPLELIEWMCRLITPIGGTVLEPFAGSGTTVEACLNENFNVIATEMDANHMKLIMKRLQRFGFKTKTYTDDNWRVGISRVTQRDGSGESG